MKYGTIKGKEYKKILQSVVTKANGWYSSEDFKLMLDKERERSQRTNGNAGYVFVDFSNHYKTQGLIDGKSYYDFLTRVVEIMNTNTRVIDVKSITYDYKISLLLIESSLAQTKQFVEKLTATMLDYFKNLNNLKFYLLSQTVVITAFSLNSIEEMARPENDDEELYQLPFANVVNGDLNPHHSMNGYEDNHIKLQNEVLKVLKSNKNTISNRSGNGVNGGNEHHSGNGYVSLNGNGVNSYKNGGLKTTPYKGFQAKSDATDSTANGSVELTLINGKRKPYAPASSKFGNGAKSEMKVTTNNTKTVLKEKENYYFNWNIFSLSNAPENLKAPLMGVKENSSPHLGYFFLKRLMDILGSLAGILLFSPILIIAAVVIKLTSKGPAFFKQKRIGYQGKLFTFLKFRSMKAGNNNQIHKEYMAKLIAGENDDINNGSEDDPLFKIKEDPRITRIGHILRKTSLDEIPQLFNVLKGDMSLVGPRPPIPYEVDLYKTWHLRRVTEVKPGVTGLWQVYGRNQTTFDDMVRLDLNYVKERSFLLDLKLIVKTFLLIFNTKSGI